MTSMLRLLQILLLSAVAGITVQALAADDGKPPLVVEAGKYSYTFTLPAGWDTSAEEAKRLKVPLMMFPKNRSFTQSASIVFIDEYCKTPCANSAAPIKSILVHASTRDPESKVEAPLALATRDGAPVELRIINSTIDKRAVREAFAFVTNPGPTLVMVRLAVGDLKVWDRDFQAFIKTLASMQFFDCSTQAISRASGMCGPEPEVNFDPNSFEGRAAVAKALYTTPDGEDYRRLVNEYLSVRHSKTMRDCFRTTEDPWTANFELIGFIDRTGSLIDAVVKPETNIGMCFTTGLLNSIFPKPPRLEESELYPVYLEVRLQP